ncbi:MAG: hypothetical protein HY288_15145 [Planctomycetia bacterium]|nr:hypothetical protein [Planctomycetia bacterium]
MGPDLFGPKAGGSGKCLTLRLDGEEAASWKYEARARMYTRRRRGILGRQHCRQPLRRDRSSITDAP